MNTNKLFISILLLVVLFGCIKEKDTPPTYFYATANGKKIDCIISEASRLRLLYNKKNDSVDFLLLNGYLSENEKVFSIGIQTMKLDTGVYYIKETNDSIVFTEASFMADSLTYSTIYNNDTLNSGKIIITELESAYIKGNFEFIATLKDQPNSFVIITKGSFYSNFK